MDIIRIVHGKKVNQKKVNFDLCIISGTGW